MTEYERQLAAARAGADRQHALAADAFDSLVGEARELLKTHGPVDAWAILGSRTAAQLECTSKYQQFAVEMLAVAAVRQAQGE